MGVNFNPKIFSLMGRISVDPMSYTIGKNEFVKKVDKVTNV